MRRAAFLVLLTLTAGCGTRIGHSEVVAAAQRDTTGPAAEEASSTSGPASSESPADESGAAGAAAAGGVTGSGAARSTGEADAPSTGPSAGGGSTTAGGVAVAPPARGGTKATLTVASLGNYSGVAGGTLHFVAEALQVWAKDFNERRPAGRTVRLLIQDDGSDPARNRAVAKKLIEQDKVIAFIANYAPLTGAATVDYFNQVKVPVVGGAPQDKYWVTSAMHFAQQTPARAFYTATMAAFATGAKSTAKTKFGVLYCTEAETCRSAGDYWSQDAPKNGVSMVYRAQVSLAQPDYTAECLSARNAGVQVLLLSIDANSVRRAAASCTRQQFRPIFATVTSIADVSYRTVAPLDGMFIAGATFPWFASDTPARKAFQDAMAKFAPRLEPGPGHSETWTAAKVFERAVRDLADPPTAAGVVRGLVTIDGDDLGGLTQRLTYRAGAHNLLRPCWTLATIRGGKFAATPDAAVHCL